LQPRENYLEGPVEVPHVLLEEVRGGDVCSSAKPPLRLHALPLVSFEVAIVEVHGGGLREAASLDSGESAPKR
jgi:hypothetical protein